MKPCKCRYCQTNTYVECAYMTMIGKQKAFFCNEEHYNLFIAAKEEKKQKQEIARQKKQEDHDAAVKQRKEAKDKVYYLICDIIGRKEIVNTMLWKEWKIWNKVANNECIGQYLEENKSVLIGIISRLKNDELQRIMYFSAILKNNLGDLKPIKTYIPTEKPNIQVDEVFYEPIQTKNNKRRSLEDLEDEF